MDRIDIQIELPRLERDELINHRQNPRESSKQVRQRVSRTRIRQLERQHCLNVKMTNRQIEQNCKLDQAGEQLLSASIDKLKLTARSYHKILRLARTIADMADEIKIRPTHLAEAIAYRQADKRWSAH